MTNKQRYSINGIVLKLVSDTIEQYLSKYQSPAFLIFHFTELEYTFFG